MSLCVENMAHISIEVNELNDVSVKNMADISTEVNDINVVSVENMAAYEYWSEWD